MKNQYFGDVGDYGKYGLLRFLAKRGVSLAVNWYLTPDDQSNHGSIRGYLSKEKNQIYDPELFDNLRELCAHDQKDIYHFAERDLIPGAIYFDEIIPPFPSDNTISVNEKRIARENWHQRAFAECAGPELVFLDPDNGLRPGKPTAKKDAPKYAYASEAASYYQRGQDVVYYCHKGRRIYAQWEKAKSIMFQDCPDASLMGVTYHRGAQRSYIFLVHPERETQYSGFLREFLATAWKDWFTEELIKCS